MTLDHHEYPWWLVSAWLLGLVLGAAATVAVGFHLVEWVTINYDPCWFGGYNTTRTQGC